MGTVTPRLGSFEDRYAASIFGWARSSEELDAWASLAAGSPDVFRRWHAEASVHPFVLFVDGTASGYGEVWEDVEEDEAEIARVIVEPRSRGRGLGKELVTLLAQQARDLGYDDIWVRVLPTNGAAIACYGSAGFVRIDPAEEAVFNEGQPRPYVWMRSESVEGRSETPP